MGFFDLFKKTDQEKVDYIRILFELAKKDGVIAPEELETISYQAVALGLNTKEVAKIKSEIGTEFKIPTSPKLKESLRKDLIFMMLADRTLGSKEYYFCQSIISKLGFPLQDLDTGIEAFISIFENSRDLDPVTAMILRQQHSNLRTQNKQ